MFAHAASAFDRLEELARDMRLRRWFSTALLGVFLVLLGVIELHRIGWLEGVLPAAALARLPHTHLHAVELVFDVILVYEVFEMALGLGQSMSGAVGRQFMLFALILLRRSFESLAELSEPIHWTASTAAPVGHLAADAFGGLAVFAILGLYYRTIRRRPITQEAGERDRFIAQKKTLALGLIALFVVLFVHGAVRFIQGEPTRVFENIFTTFILGDVALVLIALRFTTSHRVLFRNTGFAVAGVLLRLALSAPSPFDALLGVAAAVFGLGLVWVYGRVESVLDHDRGRAEEASENAEGRAASPKRPDTPASSPASPSSTGAFEPAAAASTA